MAISWCIVVNRKDMLGRLYGYDQWIMKAYGNKDNHFFMSKICVSLHHVKNWITIGFGVINNLYF